MLRSRAWSPRVEVYIPIRPHVINARRSGSQVAIRPPVLARLPLQEFLEDSVEGDGVRGDAGRIGSGGEFGKRAGAASLLENLHLAAIHRGTRYEYIVVARESIHPGRALDRRLCGRDQRELRKVEGVAAGRVAPRRGDGAGDVNALAIVPGVDERKCECHVSSRENVTRNS